MNQFVSDTKRYQKNKFRKPELAIKYTRESLKGVFALQFILYSLNSKRK